MKRFAALVDQLAFQPAEGAKRRLIRQYLADAPDPDRGHAMAALLGMARLPRVAPGVLRKLLQERVDPVLLELSFDYVGDLAETAALIWPEPAKAVSSPGLSDVLTHFAGAPKQRLPGLLAASLDGLPVSERYALIKLLNGGLRTGVSGRLVRQAIADFGGLPLAEIEELWHGLEPPFTGLFAWIEGLGAKPQVDVSLGFREPMPVRPLPPDATAALNPAEFAAEWKWDGVRVQLASSEGRVAVYSGTGDDISNLLPELVDGFAGGAVVDGELLVSRDGRLAPQAEVLHRLRRNNVTRRLRESHPVQVRLYDLLFLDGEDLRHLPYSVRRRRLEHWYENSHPQGCELSPLLPFEGWEDLAAMRRSPPGPGVDGVMLKRLDAPYLSGPSAEAWYAWKPDARHVEAVLMYVQRAPGAQEPGCLECTFGLWQDDALVPVGKTRIGGSVAWLDELLAWVGEHTVDRFGPVRQVGPGLVMQIAFDGIDRSARHKAGFTLRSPRILRLLTAGPGGQGDTLATLKSLLPDAFRG